jgi:hypothetical protein
MKYSIGEHVETSRDLKLSDKFVAKSGDRGIVLGCIEDKHAGDLYTVDFAGTRLLLYEEDIKPYQPGVHDSELYVSAHDLVTYCRECDRYYDTRVGCPCDVAFKLRSTLESKGVDCNTTLLAQETLLSISGAHVPQDASQEAETNPARPEPENEPFNLSGPGSGRE